MLLIYHYFLINPYNNKLWHNWVLLLFTDPKLDHKCAPMLTSYISISEYGSVGASQARDISVLLTLVTRTLLTMDGTVVWVRERTLLHVLYKDKLQYDKGQYAGLLFRKVYVRAKYSTAYCSAQHRHKGVRSLWPWDCDLSKLSHKIDNPCYQYSKSFS